MAHGAIPTEGLSAQWTTYDGLHGESFTLAWENGGWTANGVVSRERVQYVLRMSPGWRVRQLLVFRDLDEPDLWLATDGAGAWGEMNGARRLDLQGCVDIALPCSAFSPTVPIRRLDIGVGESIEVPTAAVDVETLAVDVATYRYERVAARSWRRRTAGGVDHLDVDELGLVVEHADAFRRLS